MGKNPKNPKSDIWKSENSDSWNWKQGVSKDRRTSHTFLIHNQRVNIVAVMGKNPKNPKNRISDIRVSE